MGDANDEVMSPADDAPPQQISDAVEGKLQELGPQNGMPDPTTKATERITAILAGDPVLDATRPNTAKNAPYREAFKRGYIEGYSKVYSGAYDTAYKAAMTGSEIKDAASRVETAKNDSGDQSNDVTVSPPDITDNLQPGAAAAAAAAEGGARRPKKRPDLLKYARKVTKGL